MKDHDRFTFFVALAFSLLGVMAGQSCKTPEAIIVMRDPAPCLAEPPPVPKLVHYPACDELDAGYVFCLGPKDTDALIQNLSAQRRWELNAWILCGPARDAGQ